MLKNKILMTKMEIIANYSFSGISLKQLSEKNEVDKRFVMKFINGVEQNIRELAQMNDLCSRKIQ